MERISRYLYNSSIQKVFQFFDSPSFVDSLKRSYKHQIASRVWILLLLTLAPAFLLADSKSIVNIYRILVVLPILGYVLANFQEIKQLFLYDDAKWFGIYTLCMLITLFWGENTNKIDNYIGKALSTNCLLILIYLLKRHHKIWLDKLDIIYLLLGMVSLTLIFYSWEGIIKLDRFSIGRGIFSWHPFVSWLAGSLAVIALHRTISRRGKYSINIAFLLFFLVCIVFSMGRGGAALFITSAITMFIFNTNRQTLRYLVLAGVMGVFIVGIFYAIDSEGAKSYINRGLTDRDLVWHNAWNRFDESPFSLLIGFGLSTSAENIYNNYTTSHYHSLYINTLFHSGMMGLIPLIILLSKGITKGFKEEHQTPWPYLATGFLLAFLFDGSSLLVYSSTMMICFLIPFFICLLNTPSNDD